MRPHTLTRYEVARIVGLRSLQLSEGAVPAVNICDPELRVNFMYVAALELKRGLVDAKVLRGGLPVHVSGMRQPQSVDILLDTLKPPSPCPEVA